MKKTISTRDESAGFSGTNGTGYMPLIRMMEPKVLFLTLAIFCFSACKRDAVQEDTAGMVKKNSAKTSAQPLPGGKARFSWVNGNFDTNGYTWERIVNLTFTASTGTVGATLWTWDSTVKKGKAAFNSHFCTFDGVSKTCSTYTPGGWVYPAGQYVSWSGTYVYNTTTGRLDITWISGASATESWQITNPTPTIARASLITSSYTLTHGRGYGSNAAWSTYKTIAQMVPFPTFSSTTSRRVYAGASTSTGTPTLLPASGFNAWASTNLNLSVFTTPSSPNPKNTMHAWLPSSACTPSSCNANPHTTTGIVYHLSSNNNGRQMAYTNFCACLSAASEWPCYPRNLHPSAFLQIIDDNNDLVALIGIEAQNPVSGDSGYPAYQFHLWDFNNIP